MSGHKRTVFRYKLNLNHMVKGFGIPAEVLAKGFSDGRRASFFTEYLTGQIFKYVWREKDAKGFDLEDSQGRKVEVKCLTKGGVCFARSSHVGSGRKCDHKKLQTSFNFLKSIVVVDITHTPDGYWNFIEIPSSLLHQWHKNGIMNFNTGRISSSKKFYAALGNYQIKSCSK